MPNLVEFSQGNYPALLAADVLDGSRGVLFGETAWQPDTANRTILIGLGGMGVTTLDRLKGEMGKAGNTGWRRYISFLALDSDWIELERTLYLDSGEKICLTQPAVDHRMRRFEQNPRAVRRFLKENDGCRMDYYNINNPGSGCVRLVGKLKLHDQVPGKPGVDEEIVNKLEQKFGSMVPLAPGGIGWCRVYVIGSLAGGTGAGCITELPALVRKAIPDAIVHAILYLPDVMARTMYLNPNTVSQFYANGYAALKELNYYMGMSMRPGYPETWSYNSAVFPELTMEGRFFDVPYLISVDQPGNPAAQDRAVERAVGFLLGRCGQYAQPGQANPVSQFEHVVTSPAMQGNRAYLPGTNEAEAAGEHHEFPRVFASFGMMEASVPVKTLQCYMVGRLCQKAGLKSVSQAERTSVLAAGDAAYPVPFRGRDDVMHAIEGTARAREILEPLRSVFLMVHRGDFNFGRDLNQPNITWTNIRSGLYDNPAIVQRINDGVKRRTSPQMMDELRKKISEAYDAYRRNVQDYVRSEGPYAFVNLYLGNFKHVNGDFGMGIERMIKNLIDGKTLEGKELRGWISVHTARLNLDAARKAIAFQMPSIFGIMGRVHYEQCAEWVDAYNKWVNARISEVRRQVALGANGALAEYFLKPAEKLTSELDAFGCILETMTDIYSELGSSAESFTSFSQARDKAHQINLATVSGDAYRWIKEQADIAWQSVNPMKFRDGLVDDFFGMDEIGVPNSMKWLEIPNDRIIGWWESGRLTRRELAVPARERFDRFIRENAPMTVNTSMAAVFAQLQSIGAPIDALIDRLVMGLKNYSEPQFNGDIPAAAIHQYIVYPSTLNGIDALGGQIVQAIINAANHHCPGIQVYASPNVDGIVMYQMAGNMEIYRLRDLSSWENYYEIGEHGLNNYQAFLHGMSPDLTVTRREDGSVTYSENIPWKDYPTITRLVGDPRVPDPETGRISREGELRIELDKTIARARELGVLYSEQIPYGWVIKRVCCGRDREWRFDLGCCTVLAPMGKELAMEVANQNGVTLESVSRTVALSGGGVMDKPAPTEEMAWAYAARILRVHVPMYIEVRETLKQFEEWAKDIFAAIEQRHLRRRPAMMVQLLKGRILKCDVLGTWVYIQPNVRPRNVAVLTDVMKKFLPSRDKCMVENGLMAYYLYDNLSRILVNRQDWDEALARAKAAVRNMTLQGNTAELTAGEELADMLLREVAGFESRGVSLWGPEEVFGEEMAQMLPKVCEEEWPKIQRFYRDFC